MASDFVMRKGSTSRSLEFTLTSENPNDSFSGVVAVDFFMRRVRATGYKIDGVAVASFTIATDTKSVSCRYDWQTTDVDQIGDYLGLARTTDSAGKEDWFPADDSEDYITIKILDT